MTDSESTGAAERRVVLALLRNSGQDFREDAAAPPILDGGAGPGWRFTFQGGAILADVYVCGSLAEISEAIARLTPAPTTGTGEFPLVSHNGGLVFAVRYDGPAEDPLASTARSIASALAGEED